MNDGDEPASGQSRVKPTTGPSATLRITPPLNVRESVGMQRDEAWSWFWHKRSGTFYLRRADARLSGIPDSALSTGTSHARKNGRYLDMAIPASAVDTADIEEGQVWAFRVKDRDTITVKWIK